MAELSFFDKVHKNDTIHTPDVLACLANLSNDEVFTPPEVVNQMLDMLPQELFHDPNTKFLDPACKTGVFLREIAKRLIVGLEDKIPDLSERLEHIFKEQLYGIAITELTSLLSRRSLYCSKYPNGQYSVVKFDNAEGNIRFRKIKHTWKDGKCVLCGASQAEYDRGDNKESHAYEFIHLLKPEELNMKIDVVISNPPYQLSDGGGGAGKSATPIYQHFIDQAKKLNPRFISMIVPSRWFNGGKGLDSFREEMLNDERMVEIDDFVDSRDCFAGVDIPGGICYFLWNKDHSGHCIVTNILKNGDRVTATRKLNEFPVFIRSNNALSIINKVRSFNEPDMSTVVSSRKPFGIDSNVQFDDDGECYCRNSSGIGKIKKSKIINGLFMLDKWKVIVSKVSFEHAGSPDKDGTMRVLSVIQVLEPNCVCSESYLVAGCFDTEKEANNLVSYMKCRFTRFLAMQMLASMNMSKSSYQFVPVQDFSKPWTDEELYAKYGITDEEIAFIESIIRPMD